MFLLKKLNTCIDGKYGLSYYNFRGNEVNIFNCAAAVKVGTLRKDRKVFHVTYRRTSDTKFKA